MDSEHYKLGLKEFVAIAIIVVGIALTDDTPSIVFEITKTAGWMQPLLSACMLIIPFLLLMKVILHFDTNDFSDIIKQILGKYLGTISLIILWMLLTIRLIIESSVYTNIIKTMFYPNTPAIIIYFTLIGMAGYIAYKGITNIGSVAWILLSSIKITLLIVFILGTMHGNIHFLLPLFGPGEAVVIKQSLSNTSLYIDLLFLCFVLPQMKSKADFPKGIWIALAILAIELAIAFTIFMIIFDYETIVLQNYPYMEILRFIHLGFLTNMESFFFPFWLMASFIRFGFYLYLQLYFIQKIFDIEHVKNIIPALVFFIVLIGMLPTSPQFTLFHMKEKIFYVASPILIFFPLLLWGTTWTKGEFKHE